MKVFLKGLNSCAMRRQNLQHYREFLARNGHELVDDPAQSDAIITWTCAFRDDVLQNSLSELENYRKAHPAKLIVAGCLPDIAPDRLNAFPDLQVIPWKHQAAGMEKLFGTTGGTFEASCPILAEPAICEDAGEYRKLHPESAVTFHDQFNKLLVTEGCPFTCTYCTERLAFPKFRSFPEDQLVKACQRLVEKTGQKRFILLSDCLGEYGRDNGSNLPSLIRRLRAVDNGLTFALNNLHPYNFLQHFDQLQALLEAGVVCHVNLPIQSASDHVLGLMNRLYKRRDLERIYGMLNRIEFDRFDTHVIAGFPGETEGDFQETIDFVLAYRPKYVLLSKFFEAPNAPAARLPAKVSPETASARIQRARSAFESVGILVNWEGGELGQERLRRLNVDSGCALEGGCPDIAPPGRFAPYPASSSASQL